MMLSGSSLSRSLSTCFAGLGEVHRRSCELNDAQAEADMREMGAVLYEYERIVGSIRVSALTSSTRSRLGARAKVQLPREGMLTRHTLRTQKAFATRIDVWQAWQKAEDEYRKTRSKHEKLVREGRSGGERMHMSLQDVADAESKSLALKRDFDLVGLRCKDEMDRFDSEKVQEVRSAVESWIQGQVERQIEVSMPLKFVFLRIVIEPGASLHIMASTAHRRVGTVLRVARSTIWHASTEHGNCSAAGRNWTARPGRSACTRRLSAAIIDKG